MECINLNTAGNQAAILLLLVSLCLCFFLGYAMGAEINKADCYALLHNLHMNNSIAVKYNLSAIDLGGLRENPYKNGT